MIATPRPTGCSLTRTLSAPGLFTVRKVFLLVVLMVPLVAGTTYTIWHIGRMFRPLARYVNLSQACEVTNGEGSADVTQLHAGHPVTKSQTHLNRGRYGQRGDGVYAVAKVRIVCTSGVPTSTDAK